MIGFTTHRLDGLEPDNLLAFMALLGLLRTLEESKPLWRTRVSWTWDNPPLRPLLWTPEGIGSDTIVEAAAEGLNTLASHHVFTDTDLDPKKFDPKKLKLSPEDAAKILRKFAEASHKDQYGRYKADLWAALISDAAVKSKKSKEMEAEQTPLCLMFGQGHQHFLERLNRVPQQKTPPKRGKDKRAISETDCLREALLKVWERPDQKTDSFRWDYNEDVRYALRARDPSKDREPTQHGANRLAAIGLSILTVAPRLRDGKVRLVVLGGGRDSFVFRWPIWREPISLNGVRALLGHPRLEQPDTRAALGIVQLYQAQRISVGKFCNFTRAEAKLD